MSIKYHFGTDQAILENDFHRYACSSVEREWTTKLNFNDKRTINSQSQEPKESLPVLLFSTNYQYLCISFDALLIFRPVLLVPPNCLQVATYQHTAMVPWPRQRPSTFRPFYDSNLTSNEPIGPTTDHCHATQATRYDPASALSDTYYVMDRTSVDVGSNLLFFETA